MSWDELGQDERIIAVVWEHTPGSTGAGRSTENIKTINQKQFFKNLFVKSALKTLYK